MTTQAFVLCAVFLVKHFVADYPLQTPWMLGKFKAGWDYVLPLTAHCLVHAAFTLTACLLIDPSLWWLAAVDFGVHFVMDRIKASPKLLGRYKALSGREYMALTTELNSLGWTSTGGVIVWSERAKEIRAQFRENTYFWWALGIDQTVHHLTDLFIVWRLLQ